MYRLIINTKTEFDAPFCELLVSHFGAIELIPYSHNYCILECPQNNDIEYLIHKSILLFMDNSEFALRLLLSESKGDIETQVLLLDSFQFDGLFSEVEPPEIILGTKIKVNKELWFIELLEFESHNE